jgi:hypothetical protein
VRPELAEPMTDWARQRGYSDRQISLEWEALCDYVIKQREVVEDWFLRWRMWWKTTRHTPVNTVFEDRREAMEEVLDAVIAKQFRGGGALLAESFQVKVLAHAYDADGFLREEMRGKVFDFMKAWKAHLEWKCEKERAKREMEEATEAYYRAGAEQQRREAEEARKADEAINGKKFPRKGGPDYLKPHSKGLETTFPPSIPDSVFDRAAQFGVREEKMYDLWHLFRDEFRYRTFVDWGGEFDTFVVEKLHEEIMAKDQEGNRE